MPRQELAPGSAAEDHVLERFCVRHAVLPSGGALRVTARRSPSSWIDLRASRGVIAGWRETPRRGHRGPHGVAFKSASSNERRAGAQGGENPRPLVPKSQEQEERE